MTSKEIYERLDALYKRLNCAYERTTHVLREEVARDYGQERYYEGYNNALSMAMVGIALILEEMEDES